MCEEQTGDCIFACDWMHVLYWASPWRDLGEWLDVEDLESVSLLKKNLAVPSSVLTWEALLLRRLSRHPPPSATPRAHSASWPCPQRSTGGDVRSLVGCHPKETWHCCWVTSVVFSSACSDSTYAGHHLLCPLLTTMLAKSRSQTEWASPQRADRRYIPPPILLCGLSDVEGFDQNCPRQGRREEHWDWGHHESVAWRATEAETFLFIIYAVIDEDDNWWCYENPFQFEATWQGRRPRLLS